MSGRWSLVHLVEGDCLISLRLLANENFPLASIDYLRRQGHDVVSIGASFGGISDEEVLRMAVEDERVILTFDRD